MTNDDRQTLYITQLDNYKFMSGHLHPLTQFIRSVIKVFEEMGFEVAEGPEMETEWFNFDALNVPAEHPSRDVQDTFWLKTDPKCPMRTHTTAVDVRVMQEVIPPVRFIIPGRCFRNEATDDSHEHTFYQIDGFMIDKNVTMANLIDTLRKLFEKLYGKNIEIRLRPHHYAFVEPGMDIDVKLKDGKWREMLGSGMLHPIVLKNMKVDPEKWIGFAFGIGIDRLMMLKYGVKDIRMSYSADLRFLKQF